MYGNCIVDTQMHKNVFKSFAAAHEIKGSVWLKSKVSFMFQVH
jgi:hypothetical protein